VSRHDDEPPKQFLEVAKLTQERPLVLFCT